MEKMLNYSQGQALMERLCADSPDAALYSLCRTVYPGLTVRYPGRKRPGDYRLERGMGQVPTHMDVCREIYALAGLGGSSCESLYRLLDILYRQGTRFEVKQSRLRDLQHLIFWVTLQEEINYPQSLGYAGRRLPFCRYFEAIVAGSGGEISLEEVCRRCNHTGSQTPALYHISKAPAFYI